MADPAPPPGAADKGRGHREGAARRPGRRRPASLLSDVVRRGTVTRGAAPQRGLMIGGVVAGLALAGLLAAPTGAQVPVPLPTTTTTTRPGTTTTSTTAPATTTTQAPATTTTSAPEAPTTTTTTPVAPTTTAAVVPAPDAGRGFARNTTGTAVPAPAVRPTTTTVDPVQRARARTVALSTPITPVAVTGGYSFGVATVLIVTLLLIFLASKANPGGPLVPDLSRRSRLIAGYTCIALAAVIALVGYLKLSEDPLVNHQIPYLASAGMAVVIFSAVGGALIIAEQMRVDDRRILELEDAVQRLAGTVGPAVEAPARVRLPAATDSDDLDPVTDDGAPTARRRRRTP